MHLLLIGNGGREHALAWKLSHSSSVSRISIAPGNPGTALEPKCHNVDIAADDIDALLDFAGSNDVQLTIVGPEAPLVAGISDAFIAAGLRIFGPQKAAAQLEGSKAYAKEFMEKHGIPTARHATFDDPESAIAWIEQHGAPIVIKADGLAAGKGVVVAMNLQARKPASSRLCQAANAWRWPVARITRLVMKVISDRTPEAWAPTPPPRLSVKLFTNMWFATYCNPPSTLWTRMEHRS